MMVYVKKIILLLVIISSFSFVTYVDAPTYVYPLIREVFSVVEYPSMVMFGDVVFDRGVRTIMEKRHRDPFEYIRKDSELLKTYDVVAVNLEGPIVEMDRFLCQDKAYTFQFASTTIERLRSIGVTMVNIANNHIYDCLASGYISTKKYLDDAGILYIGDMPIEKSFVTQEIDGKKLAFVGIDETIESIPIVDFYPIIEKLKEDNDYVIVSIHWGTEYSLIATDRQVNIGHALIDSGADVVFGHHPHVIEPVEVYKGKAIFYSLGNFVFDQFGIEENRGVGVGVEFKDDIYAFTLFPYEIKIFAPDFLEGHESDLFCVDFLKDVLNKEDCSFYLAT